MTVNDAIVGFVFDAGRCQVRMSPGRIWATFHDAAPTGLSRCGTCGRIVFRGMGRWWRGTKA